MKKLKQINTLDELVWAKADKKSVSCPKSLALNGMHPASMILSFSGSEIVRLIKLGLFVCEED